VLVGPRSLKKKKTPWIQEEFLDYKFDQERKSIWRTRRRLQ